MYPEDSIQAYAESWWIRDEARDVRRGRLLRAFVPHIPQVPMILTLIGRLTPTDHTSAGYRLEPLKAIQPPRLPKLPVAALPLFEGEILTAFRAKKRPVLVISTGAPQIPRDLTRGSPKWQSIPMMLVAPYYGAEPEGRRAGFKGEFVTRVRRCEYPHVMWDRLPIGGGTDESILRLDQTQPLARHPDAYEWTPHCLSEEALDVVDEWLHWLITSELPQGSALLEFREGLSALDVNP